MTNIERWLKYCEDFESPDLFVTWGFYSLVSSALQRRVWLFSNPTTGLPSQNSIFLNQFIVLIGPPACGKSRIIKNVKAVCSHEKNQRAILSVKSQQVVVTTSAITCTPDNITFEGFFEFLAKNDMTDGVMIPHGDTEVAYAHNSATACLEELGVMFTKQAEDVASLLCQAYDAGDLWRWTKTQGKDLIKNVCVNFLAGTTTDAVKRMMANRVVQEGFSTRVIFVFADRPRFYRFSSPTTSSQQEAFNEIVAYINKLATVVKGPLTLSPEAIEFMTEMYESRKLLETDRVNHDPILNGYYGRKKMHWIKLAGIFQLSESLDSMTIELPAVKNSLALLNRTEKDMHLSFRDSGVNPQHELAGNILTYIKNHGETTYKRLFLEFFKDGSKQSFDETLTFLEVTDQLLKTGSGYKLHPNHRSAQTK